MKGPAAAAAALALGLLAPWTACWAAERAPAVELLLRPPLPAAGERVEIEIRGLEGVEAGSLSARYLPGSRLAQGEDLGSPASGALAWRPARAGLVRLELTDSAGESLARHDLSVRYPAAPRGAVAVLLAAGLLLAGGAAYSLRAHLGGPGPAAGPST